MHAIADCRPPSYPHTRESIDSQPDAQGTFYARHPPEVHKWAHEMPESAPSSLRNWLGFLHWMFSWALWSNKAFITLPVSDELRERCVGMWSTLGTYAALLLSCSLRRVALSIDRAQHPPSKWRPC